MGTAARSAALLFSAQRMWGWSSRRTSQLSFRYNKSRIAFLRASFASASDLRSSALIPFFAAGPSASGSLHAGHRLANPGFPGFNSNSSEQTTQTLIGKAILLIILSTAARDSPQFPENN